MEPPVIKPIATIPVTSVRSSAPSHVITTVGHQFCGLSKSPKLTGRVELLPEPSNPADPNVVAVLEDGQKVCYVAKSHLHWIHALLTGHLTQIREADGMHAEELTFPLLLNFIEQDSIGNLYGALLVVGIDSDFNVATGDCTIVQRDVIERHPEWKVTLSTGEVRRCAYKSPVSAALVRSYFNRKHYKVEEVVPLP